MPRAEPVQLRGIRRKENIIAAARDIYNEQGRDMFNTEAVAKRVGCAIGTIYRYFENRVDLMDAVAPDRDREGVRELIGRIRDVRRMNMNLDGLGDGSWVDGNELDTLLQEYA